MWTKVIYFVHFSLLVLGWTAQAHTDCLGSLDSEPIVKGVWVLTGFKLDDGKGNITPWCDGAYGVIIYTAEYMSVAINCKSDPKKVLHYSGPFEVDSGMVIHNVQNFSDPSYHQVYRRKIIMHDQDHMDLEGPFGDGGKATISWIRRTED